MMYLSDHIKNSGTICLALNLLFVLILVTECPGQSYHTEIEGNGLFLSNSSTNLDIINSDDNTNALVRFGDNSTNKASLGFNGNEDLFKISMGTTLGREDLTITQNGRIAVNAIPESARLLINHNSTSGTGGSAHLSLRENDFNDFARLRFENSSNGENWQQRAWATDGLATMRFSYDTGQKIEDIITLDGEQFRVGINQAVPEGYLHIKQRSGGVDDIVFENDPAGSTERVDWRVGTDDILIYFDQGLRASFDAQMGNLNSFPLTASSTANFHPAKGAIHAISQNEVTWKRPKELDKTRTDRSLSDDYLVKDTASSAKPTLNSLARSEKTALLIKAIQERQVQIERRADIIARLEAENQRLRSQLDLLEK